MAVAPIRANEGAKPNQKQYAIDCRPVGEGHRLSFEGTNFTATRDALAGTFGKFPIRLDKSHKLMLAAMAEVAKANGKGQIPYTQIIDAIHRYGDIELNEL